jgi:type II secretory pathway component PulK
LVEAILDWRDSDDSVRARGAEREWYDGQHRTGPRNAALAAVEELHLVRGFERASEIDSLAGVESEKIVLSRAPVAVLAALPGVGPEAIARLTERRAAGLPIRDVAQLADALSLPARAVLLANYAELARLTTVSPEAWTIISRFTAGKPAVTATLELRVMYAGGRVAIVQRRSWP